MESRLKKYWLPHSLDSSARITEASAKKTGQALLVSCAAVIPFLLYALVHVFTLSTHPVEFALFSGLTLFFLVMIVTGSLSPNFRATKLRAYIVYSLPLGSAGLYYNMTVSESSLASMLGTFVCMVYVSTLVRTKAEGVFVLSYFVLATTLSAIHHPDEETIRTFTPATFACLLFLSISHYYRILREANECEQTKVLGNAIELWNRMLDNPSVNLSLIDCSGQIVHIGRSKLATGLEAPIGANFHDFTPPEYAAKLDECLDRSAATREATSFESTVSAQSGKLITYSTTVWPVVEGEEILGFMAMSLDISDRVAVTRKANHLSQVSILGQMSAGIAHEIRNPLTVIDGNLDLIESLLGKNSNMSKSSNFEALLQRLKKVKNMTARINEIVKNVSRMYHSGDQEEVSTESVQVIVNEALSFARQKCEERGIALRVEQDDPNLTISCRPLSVSQAIVNLIHNAIDAVAQIPDPWIKVGVEDCGETVLISVIDSGSGLPEVVLENFGSAFYTTKVPGKGTGLGINLVMKVVSEHGGEFNYDRAYPNTKFDIILPKEAKAASAA